MPHLALALVRAVRPSRPLARRPTGKFPRRGLLLPVLGLLVTLSAATPAQGLCGDCDSDGIFTVLDALLASRIGAGLAIATPLQMIDCDVDGSGTITVIDALQMAQFVVGLPVVFACGGGGPPAATKLYVNVGNAVEVVDLATNTSIGTIPHAGAGQGIAIDAGGGFVYASFAGTLIEIDTSTDTISRSFPLSLTTSRKVAVAGNFVYVALFSGVGSSMIDRVNRTTSVVTSLAVPASAWEITVNQAGTQLYVGHIGLTDMVTRIDVATFTAALSAPLANDPISIEENPSTGAIYVGCRDANPDVSGLVDLHEVNPTTLAVVQSFAIDDAFGMAVTPDSAYLYVCSNHNQGPPIPPYFVQKVDLVSAAVLPTMILVGDQPWYFALDAAGTSLFTCDNASLQITRIDVTTDTVVATIPLSAAPRDAVTR